MKIVPFSIRFFLLAVSLVSEPLFAATEVKFANADLEAISRLASLERTTLRLHERRGEFRPGPSLRFTGMEPQDFEIELSVGKIVDLRFNDLRGKAASLTLEQDRARLDFVIEDQEKAIRSALGSVSLKGVRLSAWVRFSIDGTATLVFDDAAITGELKGSGLLKPKWVIDALRKIALKSVRDQVERQLARPSVQKATEEGLVLWARFSVEDKFTRIVRSTIQVSKTALRYEAE